MVDLRKIISKEDTKNNFAPFDKQRKTLKH